MIRAVQRRLVPSQILRVRVLGSGARSPPASWLRPCAGQVRAQSTESQRLESPQETEISSKAPAPSEAGSLDGAQDPSEDDVPWYLRPSPEDLTQLTPSSVSSAAALPPLPPNPPPSLSPLLAYLSTDLGLHDLQLLDLRSHDPPTVFGPDAIMLVSSGKSDKHIGKAAQALLTFVKKEFGTVADQEGVVSGGYVRLVKKRARKKTKKLALGMAAMGSEGLESGRFLSDWVALDTKVDGLIVHMFTEQKRQEMDLEYIWAKNRKELRERRKREGGVAGPFSSPVGSVRRLHTGVAARSTESSFPNPASSPNPASPILQEMNVFSYLGNYAKVKEIYNSTHLGKRAFDPKSLLAASDAESDQALLVLLKSHINHLSKLKHSAGQAGGARDGESTVLKQSSDVVSSFVGSFPSVPSPEHWRLRLIFFQRAHMINPSEFPLAMLTSIAIQQQAAGLLADRWTVDFIMNTIIHSKQYANERFLKASSLKSRIALSLVLTCIRPLAPSGKVKNGGVEDEALVPGLDDSLLILFYRLWINESNNLRKATVFPSSANEESDPAGPESPTPLTLASQVQSDHRARVMTPQALQLYHYFSSHLHHLNTPSRAPTSEDPSVASAFLLLSFTSFVNDGLWNSFWALWKKTVHSSVFSPALFHTMIALVSKSGDRKAMARLVEYEVPNVLLLGDQYLNRSTVKVLARVLETLDPSENGYPAFRRVLEANK